MSDVVHEDFCPIEYVTPKFTMHKFGELFLERRIVYQVIRMEDSLLLFINDKDNMNLSNLFVALMNPYQIQPIATRLLGDFMEEVSKSLSIRLSKKLKKTVYVSCNIGSDTSLLPSVEKRIYDEIKENPDAF